MCESTTASPLLWHCSCLFPCDNIVKLKQIYSWSRSWGQRTPGKSVRLCFNLSGQSHSTVAIFFLVVRNRVCFKLQIFFFFSECNIANEGDFQARSHCHLSLTKSTIKLIMPQPNNTSLVLSNINREHPSMFRYKMLREMPS